MAKVKFRRWVPLGIFFLVVLNIFRQRNNLVSYWLGDDNSSSGQSEPDSHNGTTARSRRRASLTDIDPFYFERPPNQWIQDAVHPKYSHHAIVIPYRDRQFHLDEFQKVMHPYLEKHFPNDTFSVWIIEQDDQELFNRAWLANVGLHQILLNEPETRCVILHDVDLVPKEPAVVPYTTCEDPTQLGSELEQWDWSYPYPTYCGGITSLSLAHWQLINGLSNDYVGWGGEDDDLYHRLRINALLQQSTEPGYYHAPVPRRPPIGSGVFRTISEAAEHHVQHKKHSQKSNIKQLTSEMYHNSNRWKFDGLNDVYYTVTGYVSKKMGTTSDIHHVKVIPQKSYHPSNNSLKQVDKNSTTTTQIIPNTTPILEFVPIPYTGANGMLTMAAASAGIVWGACHYLLPGQSVLDYGSTSDEDKSACPVGSGDFRHEARFHATYQEFQTPWLLPSKDIITNPLEGTHRFTVVRDPYQRALDYYRQQNRDQQNNATIATEQLNAFLQENLEHLPTQLEYVLSNITDNTTNYIHHVLRYEHVLEDWNKMVSNYPYLKKAIDVEEFMMQQDHFQEQEDEEVLVESSSSAGSKLGVKDLTNLTLAILNRRFDLDFSHFGYMKQESTINATKLPLRAKPVTVVTAPLAPLQLLDIPFNGGDALTRAASKAGIAWGACHFEAFDEWGCPKKASGDFRDLFRYQGSYYEAQTKWPLPSPKDDFHQFKTFAVVRNPYSRAIYFYRHMYDLKHEKTATAAVEWLEQNTAGNDDEEVINSLPSAVARYLASREDPTKLNTFIQNAMVLWHRPHRPDPVSLPLQVTYKNGVDDFVRYESLVPDLEKLLVTYNLTRILEGLSTPEPRLPRGTPWLDISDLDEISVDMLNRAFWLDFRQWYPTAKRTVNVTTFDYWKRSQKIEPSLHKWINYMSTVSLKVAVKQTKPKERKKR